MQRPVWNGTISFGLLNIPVSLMTAEKRVDLHFRMVDSRTNQPIRYERVNSETGAEVPWKDIVQAFEYKKGNYVVLSKDEIAKAAPEGKETIDIEGFVDRSEIDMIYFEKPYYLIPGKKAEKGYVLLRELLRDKNRAGIGHVIIRTRRYLCAVLPLDNILVLNLLRFHQEIVDADDYDLPAQDLKKFRISQREVDMAGQLVDSMTVAWNPAEYVDDYRERLIKIVEKQLASKQGLIHDEEQEQPVEHAATNVVDFMALLEKSLKSGRRSAGAQADKAPVKSASAKAAKKTPGKAAKEKTSKEKSAKTTSGKSAPSSAGVKPARAKAATNKAKSVPKQRKAATPR